MNKPNQRLRTSPTSSQSRRRKPLQGLVEANDINVSDPGETDAYYSCHDYQTRTNPTLMNGYLRRAVPVLDYTDWKITDVNGGYCESLLPLNEATTNQHGTHQAALISLSADYTGGMALVAVLEGIPIAGLHPDSDNSASLWLAAMDVKYLKPSTGHLIGRCTVPTEIGEKLLKRYQSGKRILVTLDVNFESNGEEVAIAKMKYFAQPTEQLLDCSSSISPLFAAKIKASARMIAGVRAKSTVVEATDAGQTMSRVDCPHATLAAGPHGLLLADRMKQALPQLPPMVMARTRSINEMLHKMQNLEQIVMLGAGLDMRPYQFADKTTQEKLPHVFELDLEAMLIERNRVVAEINRPEVKRTPIVANFLHDDIEQLLMSTEDFDPEKITAFIYEGCSMYFDALVNASLVTAVGRLMKNANSRFWADFVSSDVADGTVEHPAIKEFLFRMNELGEAFTFGVDEPSTLLVANGFSHVSVQTVSDYLGQHDDSEKVLTRYMFTESSK